MDSTMSFFKVISPSQPLTIPEAFFREAGAYFGNSFVLIDKYGNMWEIEVSEEQNSWCFAKGWDKFYLENGLECGNALVFEHQHDNVFHVKLFGLNACEKVGMGHFCFKLLDAREKKGIGNSKVCVDEDEDVNIEDEEVEDDNDDNDEDDGYYGVDEVVIDRVGEKQPRRSKGKVPEKRLRRSKGKLPVQSTGVESPDNKLAEWYGDDIFKSGLAMRPNNPYFVSRSRTGRSKNKLGIPVGVPLDFGFTIPERVTLVDEQGRQWDAKIKQWQDGRRWCTREWKAFCYMNNIQDDDICICEFVRERGKVHMQVSVVQMD